MAAAKTVLRAVAVDRRRAMSQVERAGGRATNAQHLRRLLSGLQSICVFLPLPTEPLADSLLDDLVRGGAQVLVPVTRPDAPLDWCAYPAPLTAGRFGVQTPDGPRLGAAAIRNADVVVVPAFAVDATGVRLGRGGGHYDRTLALLAGQARLVIAVLFDGEFVDRLPAEAHDRSVGAVVTPSRGVEHLG